MPQFLLNLTKAVATQIIGVIGIFFVFGFVLSQLQEWTHHIYQRAIGWKGILWTAWIGTPVHELGHVFFAKIFRHRILHISLFKPNERTGGLGHVNHSYESRSLYQRIGNFFIGAAPMIMGSVVLLVFLYFLVPHPVAVFEPLKKSSADLSQLLPAVLDALKALFVKENFHHWFFALFLYLSFCVVAHIAPSKEDRRAMWGGFAWIIVLLIIANIIALLLKFDLTNYIFKVNQYLSIFVAIFSYAIILSIVHFVVALLLLGWFRKK